MFLTCTACGAVMGSLVAARILALVGRRRKRVQPTASQGSCWETGVLSRCRADHVPLVFLILILNLYVCSLGCQEAGGRVRVVCVCVCARACVSELAFADWWVLGRNWEKEFSEVQREAQSLKNVSKSV